MTEPIFDHDRLDVYRLAVECTAESFRVAKGLSELHRHARDQWLWAAQSIPMKGDGVGESQAEYPELVDDEHEHRFAEHEQNTGAEPEQ